MTEAAAVEAHRPLGLWTRIRAYLAEPVDIASLAVFRMLFGSLLAVSALRFMFSGWLTRFYGERSFFFKYWGFEWVEPLSVDGMFAVYTVLVLLALCVALGFLYRVAIALLFLTFTYTELTDVTNYLNHYYLVSLLCFLMCFMPLSGAYALDARLWPRLRRDSVPRWMLWLLRFQICVVYFFASKAKWGSDWLVHGQPLRSWMLAQVDLPLIGPWLAEPRVAVLVSWLGMLHDLLVPPLLLWGRTRRYAYAALLTFHTATSQWFNIGIFPVLMPVAATLFFDVSWPRRWVGQSGPEKTGTTRARSSTPLAQPCTCTCTCTVAHSSSSSRLATPSISAATTLFLTCYVLLQLLIPLRSHLYGGNVLWHEQGMRYSWRVLLRAKHGSVQYRVKLKDGRELRISPRRYLTQDQEREMSGQPDLILQLAHHIAREFDARGLGPVQVRVDALVALNGRAAVRMIDPTVDLARVQDGLGEARWITPGPP